MVERLPFPLNDQVPPELKGYLLDFWWDREKLYSLNLPTKCVDVAVLAHHLNLPYWQWGGRPFTLSPYKVLSDPLRYTEQFNRTMEADLGFPIAIFEQSDKIIILDGVHRLLRAYAKGDQVIEAAVFSEKFIPEILHVEP